MDIGKVSQGIPLNGASASSDPVAAADAARQLEQQFARMLISSMRSTSLGDEMFPGSSEHYRDMYDQQLAAGLTRGKGLGLQDMIRRQLGGSSSERAGVSIEQAAKMYSMEGYRRLPGAMALPAQARPVQTRPLPAPLPVSPPEWIGRAGERQKVAAEAAPTGAGSVAQSPVGPSEAKAARGGERAASAATASSEAKANAVTRAASNCDGTPATNPKPNSPEAFVAAVWPHAQRAAAELGVCPKVLVAQAALETGWGRHTIRGANGDANNLFGIKAGGRWQGEAVTQRTSEFVNGARVQENAAFRAYRSVAESFADYVNLIKNSPRYAAAVGASTARAFAGALQRAGYATDPQYAAKLTAIVEGPTLSRALARIDGSTTQGA